MARREAQAWGRGACGVVAAVFGAMGVLTGAGTAHADAEARTLVRGEAMPQYAHDAVWRRLVGQGPRSYWLFEPAEPTPTGRVPVVVFLHGWLAVNPGVYGAWIEHLVRSGAVVVFPRYQDDYATASRDFLANATAAIRDALDVLETAPNAVRPDVSRFALVGHSAGGNLAAQIAATSAESHLPVVGAVVAVMPGEVERLTTPRLDGIPKETRLLVVVGDRDWIAGDQRAREIYAGATAVPRENKEYVLYRTDRTGPEVMLADHLAPTGATARFDSGDGPFRLLQFSRAGVDLLDRHGFWRVTDLALLAAFTERTLAEVSEDGALFRDLGRWSDGRAVRAPLAGDDLDAIPRVLPSRGPRMIGAAPEPNPRR